MLEYNCDRLKYEGENAVMKEETKKVKIELEMDERYLQTMLCALDLYSRILMGQTENIATVFGWHSDKEFSMRKLRELCDEIKTIAFPDLSSAASYGIAEAETPDVAKLAYELRRVLEHDFAWLRKPEGGHTTEFHEVSKVSGDEYEMPKVKVEYVDEREEVKDNG